MKILHVSTPLTWRGGEQQLAYLVDELNLKGVEQIILCASGSAVERYCHENQLTCFTFNRINLQIIPAHLINEICKNKKITLIHAHDSHAHTAAVVASMFFGSIPPVIVSRRTIFPIAKNWLSRIKYNHASVSRIVCVSDKIKEQANGSIHSSGKIVTVHSGIDLNRYHDQHENTLQLDQMGTRPFIGNVAAISEEKDYITFVNTAEAYFRKGKQGTFFIIGDGPCRKQIEQYIEKKGLKDRIVFTGFRKNISGIIKQLDCFLFTSHTEGFGTSILDAMACRIPVVATHTGGIPEIVIHDETGMLAPVMDSDALSDCLIKIITDPLLRKTLINRAYLHVLSFTKQKMAALTFDIYQQVLIEKSFGRVPLYQRAFHSSLSHI